MCVLLKNPLIYILIINILTLIWGIKSWKKNIREKWMNSLRDAGADVIGAAELVYGEVLISGVSLQPQTMSSFIAKEQKLLLLFAHDEEDRLAGVGRIGQITAGCMHDTFWGARTAACIQNEQGIFRIHLFRFAYRGNIFSSHFGCP